jgi:hypothetical protein
MRSKLLVLAGVVSIVAVGLPAALRASGTVEFPGGLGSVTRGAANGQAETVAARVDVDGRVFAVLAVIADPEQTAIAYRVSGTTADGQFVTIGARPRLLLGDGTIVQVTANRQSEEVRSEGTMVFPGLPPGRHDVRLEIDGLRFDAGAIDKRFSVAFSLDNRAAHAASSRIESTVAFGEGAGAITIREIVRTPTLVVVRGTFDGMTADQIQQLGRPEFWLTDKSGRRVSTESGRMGFGDGYRSFELRFPVTEPGPGRIELRGFSGDSSVVSQEVKAKPPFTAITVP